MNNRFVKFASAIALSAILFTACAKAPKDALVKLVINILLKNKLKKNMIK